MKTTIRTGSFETNSSSTHALVMTTVDEYREWKNGNLYYSADQGRFMSLEETMDCYQNYVEYRDCEWEPLDEGDYISRGIAESLNHYNAANKHSYSIWAEDEGELNGVAGICFYIGD